MIFWVNIIMENHKPSNSINCIYFISNSLRFVFILSIATWYNCSYLVILIALIRSKLYKFNKFIIIESCSMSRSLSLIRPDNGKAFQVMVTSETKWSIYWTNDPITDIKVDKCSHSDYISSLNRWNNLI